MKHLLIAVILFLNSPNAAMIQQAKNYILKIVSKPETVKFHDEYTEVKNDTVTIKFTFINAIGIKDTLTMNIKVE